MADEGFEAIAALPDEVVEKKWFELCTLVGVEDTVSAKWWGIIRDHYCEEWRHYHTLCHLGEILAGFDRYENEVMDPVVVLFAIYFHDVIYVPTSATNEDDSAELFLQFVQEAGHPTDRQADLVYNYIIDTKNHKPGASHLEAADPDALLFLDLDMAVLGKPPSDYDEYAASIRREYIHVPSKEYCARRAVILRSFLSGGEKSGGNVVEQGGQVKQQGEEGENAVTTPTPPPIYISSTALAAALEPLARANIFREIAMLEQGVIPGFS